MTISPNARTVWRNYPSDGIPSSGVHKVSKADIRTWGTAVETVLNAFTTNGGLIYSTMSVMNAAASAFTEPRSAWQFEAGSEGVYVLNPTTDTWTKVGRLPYDFVIGTDTGAGTANAIQITTDIPVADGMIVAFSLFEATTSSPVTVAINAGAALTLKTNRGGNASALTSGMEIWGRYRASDSTFRMLNDQDVSTLVAQAEAARDAAVAAAASVNLPAVLTPLTIPVTNAAGTLREDLTAPEVKTFLNVENTTRAFATSAALLLATVAEDNIVVADVPMKAATDGTFLDSTGKKFKPAFWVTPKLFGAAGDGTTDDLTALRACWDAAGLYRVPALMGGLEYNCSDSVFTSSNLTVHGQGAVMYITAWPSVGGFINNVRPIAAERAQSNIRFYDLVTDGSKLPTPTAGQNCNLGPEFVRGASDIIVQGCTARYIREGSGGGPGGAGFGGEVGIKDAHFINCIAHDCYRGYRVAGKSGTNDDGSERWCLNVTFKDCSAIRCGAATFCHAVGEPGDYTASNLAIFEAVFDGLYVEDCGHQGWFAFPFDDYPTVVAQKSGVFTFAGAQNIRMRGLRVKINSTYPASFTDWLGRTGWPAGGTGLLGSGLSGNVGALFLGHGRNIVVDDCTIDGITDVIWKCARAQAMGDWASVPPTGSNVAQNVFNIRQVRSGGYLYVFDGGDVGANLMAALSSSVIRLTPTNNPATGVVGTDGTVSQPTVRIEFISNDGKIQGGTADEWKAVGNARPSGAQSTYLLGGIDLAGGYSATGTKPGLSYDSADGLLRSSQNATTAKFHQAYYNPNGLVGSIQTSSSATTFATTSDETLKDFIGEYDWRDAFRIIKADPVRDFTWKTSGEYAVGWGAQTSYELQPDLAAKGGWFDADWQACEEGTEGATYMPWGIDHGKRTPYLWAAVSRLIDEVADLQRDHERLTRGARTRPSVKALS